MKMEVTVNGRAIAKADQSAVLIGASERFHARRLQARLQRTMQRHQASPERQSVAMAMAAVETKLIEAFWTLARLPCERGNGFASIHGIDYLMDRTDKWAAAVAGGRWLTEPCRPSPPSAAAIDAMEEPLTWLSSLSREQAKIVAAGAQAKRGDIERRISWGLIRIQLPQFADWSSMMLRRTYYDGIRCLVAEGRR